MYFADKGQKRGLLSWLIGSGDWRQVLVFTRTKHGANRLAEQLSNDGLSAAAIHGNKSQGARTRALADFKQGTVRVLVATDIAARGLDIDQLPHVVNYDLPEVAEHYVHRIGRTGRAGNEGLAVSLVAQRRAAAAESHRAIARLRATDAYGAGLRTGPRRAPTSGRSGGTSTGSSLHAITSSAAIAVNNRAKTAGIATAAATSVAARVQRRAAKAAAATDLRSRAAAHAWRPSQGRHVHRPDVY